MNYIKLYFLIFCLSFAFGCSKYNKGEPSKPQLVSINLIDQNGMSETISQEDRLKQYASVNFLEPQRYQKVLRVYARDAFGSIKAVITSYHPNGQIWQYLEVSDNRAFGTYREWFLDGHLKLKTEVIGGIADLNTAAEKSWLFDGCSEVFNECGNLIATIEYVKGELHGNSLYYHDNGKIWRIIPFRKNLVEGVFEAYLEDGTLFQTSCFSNDVKHGKTIRYWQNKAIAADEDYLEGRLITGFYYDCLGNLVAKIIEGEGFRAVFGKESVCELQEYHNGVQEGEIQVFDLNSIITKVCRMKNGMKHGEEMEFYENGSNDHPKPKISIFWSEDKIHGLVKTWYENGNQESQREMTNNTKNGLFTAWYRDGSVMFLESYDHDKLVKGQYFKKQEKIPVSEITNGNGIAILHDSEGNFTRKIQYHNGKPQD